LKVYMRSYKRQTALMVMGSRMCIASALEWTVRNAEWLSILRLFCLGLGIASWFAIQVDRIRREGEMKKRREALRAKKAQQSSQGLKSPVRRGL